MKKILTVLLSALALLSASAYAGKKTAAQAVALPKGLTVSEDGSKFCSTLLPVSFLSQYLIKPKFLPSTESDTGASGMLTCFAEGKSKTSPDTTTLQVLVFPNSMMYQMLLQKTKMEAQNADSDSPRRTVKETNNIGRRSFEVTEVPQTTPDEPRPAITKTIHFISNNNRLITVVATPQSALDFITAQKINATLPLALKEINTGEEPEDEYEQADYGSGMMPGGMPGGMPGMIPSMSGSAKNKGSYGTGCPKFTDSEMKKFANGPLFSNYKIDKQGNTTVTSCSFMINDGEDMYMISFIEGQGAGILYKDYLKKEKGRVTDNIGKASFETKDTVSVLTDSGAVIQVRAKTVNLPVQRKIAKQALTHF